MYHTGSSCRMNLHISPNHHSLAPCMKPWEQRQKSTNPCAELHVLGCQTRQVRTVKKNAPVRIIIIAASYQLIDIQMGGKSETGGENRRNKAE